MADIGALFGGLAQGFGQGVQLQNQRAQTDLARQKLGLEEQTVGLERSKVNLQLSQFMAQKTDAAAIQSALADPAYDATNNALTHIGTLRDAASLPPTARKPILGPILQGFSQQYGVQIPPTVAETLMKVPPETLGPVLDNLSAAVNAGTLPADQIVQVLSNPTLFASTFASHAAAAGAATSDGQLGPDTTSVMDPARVQYDAIGRQLTSLDGKIARLSQARVSDPAMLKQVVSMLNTLQTQRNTLLGKQSDLTKPTSVSAGGTAMSIGGSATMPGKPDTLSADAEAQQIRIAGGRADATANAQMNAAAGVGKIILADPNTPIPDGVTGDEGLQYLKPDIRNQVKAIANGEQDLPSGGTRNPKGQAIRDAAMQLYNVDEAAVRQRRDVVKDFSNTRAGSAGGTLQSSLTLLGHMGQLKHAMDLLGNGDSTHWNAFTNYWRKSFGSAAPTTPEQVAGYVAEEATRVYRGANGAEADIARAIQDLKSSQSQEQSNAAFQTMAHLLYSKIAPLRNHWDTVMGSSRPTNVKTVPFMTPEAARTLREAGVKPEDISYLQNGAGTGGSGQVKMQDPSGKFFMVPADQADAAKAHGWKPAQ